MYQGPRCRPSANTRSAQALLLGQGPGSPLLLSSLSLPSASITNASHTDPEH